MLDSAGNLYIADMFDNEVREVVGGTITRFAGSGPRCTSAPNCGDGDQARSARLAAPNAVAIDAAGNVYIADSGDNEVRVVAPDDTISRFAGDGTACSSAPSCGDAGAALSAQLNTPSGVAMGPGGDVPIADTAGNEVRRVH